MAKILISCLIGIGLSLLVSWVIFQTNFFHSLLKDLLGQKQYEDWHGRFNRLIGQKAQKLGQKDSIRSPFGSKAKVSMNSHGPKNWQEEVFAKLKGQQKVLDFIKSAYLGDKTSLKKIKKISGLEVGLTQTYIREILAEENDFSFFDQNSIIEYLALRSYLVYFRENSSRLKHDNDYALMGIYLSKCGISDKQLHQYWTNKKSSIHLKFKARSHKQYSKIEKEMSYQYKKIKTLELNIEAWIKRIEKPSFNSGSHYEKKKSQQKTSQNIRNLNPDKYQDALKIFDLKNITSKSSLKKQYRKLAMKLHPDRVASSDKTKAHQEFVQVQKAYETLQKYAA